MQALGQAVAAAGITPAEIAAVGITNQRETTILWERASGRPVGNAIVWQCRRTAALCDRLKADGAEPEIRRKTGLVVDAYFSGTKIRWMLDHDPALRPRAERGELCFGTVDAWLLWQLTGGAVHATDPSNASRTLCFDIHRRAWDEGLCRILGVPMALLPEVKPSAGVFGETAAWRGAAAGEPSGYGEPSGLPPGIPVAGIAGDQQAALFGQACVEPGMAKNTYGTGCFALLNTGERAVASERGPADHGGVDGGGQHGLRARGRGVHRGRGRAVAARRPRHHPAGRGDAGAGRVGPGHRRRLSRARLRGPGRALLGSLRAGHAGRDHARHRAAPTWPARRSRPSPTRAATCSTP